MTSGASKSSLAGLIRTAPVPADAARADARFLDLLRRQSLPDPARDLLRAIADHSPFLWRLASADPARLRALLIEAPDISLRTLVAGLGDACDTAADGAAILQVLRKAKQSVALLAALADLGGVWDVVRLTEALTLFADAAVAGAVRYLLRQAEARGHLTALNPQNPEKGSGFVVLALGKHGAGELNYSSDIDLVVLFDPKTARLAAGLEPAPVFVRLTKALVRLIQERTPDGYVFRVDLRLRPDPGSTAIAIALPAAFAYYEMLGQNWERAAFIKARPVAGDRALGDSFIADLAPFIWRKYFDYAAIADVHAMKRQIHAAHGHSGVAVAGHNIKLGRGGIREIEFFVQTQQLIFGGRRLGLRGPRTLDMLRALWEDGWVTEAAARDLAAAYEFLRRIEHRLQMIADAQTQQLPSDPPALARFALFCGFPSLPAFEGELLRHLRCVERHYALLFEHAPRLSTDLGSLMFTGPDADPDTLKTLRRLGFQQPELAAEIVRGWHFGRRPAVRTSRAREVLTELVPALLESFAASGDPDAALKAMDAALARMPAANELLSLLKSNVTLRDLFAGILGAAPRLARTVAQRPHVLDAVIDPARRGATAADPAVLRARVAEALARSDRFEDFLDRARDIRQEETFLIGVNLLSGAIGPDASGSAHSALAETLIGLTLDRVQDDFSRDHGRVPGGACIVLGMGKLGSRDMSAASDLDLILIYDFDAESPQSDGVKPLHAVQYFTRLTQRLISALTVPTRRGTLYAVDMRLRPSGGKGPLATQFSRFLAYQRTEAQTWEHLALTRARIVAGRADLARRVEAAITSALCAPRPIAVLARDVLAMRALIARVKGDGGDFDLKTAPGGLIDIEFLAQFLVLAHAHRHPRLLRSPPRAALAEAIAAGVIGAADGDALIAAHRLIAALAQVIGTCLDAAFDPETAPEGVRRRLAAFAGVPNFASVERDLLAARGHAHRIFADVLAAAAAI